MIKKKLIIGAVALVSALAVGGSLVAKGNKAPLGIPVETTTLAPMALSNTVSLTGIVESTEGRKVYSSLTYPVDKVNVKVGDTVKEGDILCVLESDTIQLDIAQQQASIESSRELSAHQIQMSEKAYENAKENYEKGLDSALISAESGITQAENGVQQAENTVQQAENAAAQAEDSVAAARAAVNNARENYRIAQSQANGQVDNALEALNDAQAALTKAQGEYNNAVSSIPSAVEGLKESFKQIQADYDEASRLQNLDLQDISDEIKGYNSNIDEKNNELLNNANLTNEQKEEILRQIEELRLSIRDAETRKKQLLENFSNVQDNYTQAKAANESAIASVQSQASSAAGAVSSAQAQANSAKSAYNSSRDAANGSSLNSLDQSIDSARRSKSSSDTQLDNAESQIETAEKQVEAAEKQVETARKQKEASENAIQQQLDSLKDQIRSNEITAKNTQAQEIAVKKLQDSLNDTIVKSPINGTITAVYATQGEPGNGLLFVIEDTDALKITTKIKEYDVANTKEGMKTIIKTDATGDKEILGTVSKINPVAIKNEKGDTQSSSAVEFETEVDVSEKDTGLRIGMTARLRIILSEKDNVYGVPYDAIIKNEDGSSSVFISEAKEEGVFVAKSVPVTTGLETDFYIEVSGTDLKDGVSVLNSAAGMVEGQQIIPNIAGDQTVTTASPGAVMMIG